MAADRLTVRTWTIAAVAVLLSVGVAVAGWRWWTERYTVTVEDDGAAITRVVAATLRGAGALKVATLAGTVQSTAADTRLGGLLSTDQVMKAPFRGRDRPDMSAGCPERVDRQFFAFLHYILTFRRRKRPAIERALATSGVAVVRLTSVAGRGRFARGLDRGATASPRSPAPPRRGPPPA